MTNRDFLNYSSLFELMENLVGSPDLLIYLRSSIPNLVGQIHNAGSVFLGSYTPEALGDYLAGANHILPTEGTARFSSPLGVYDFYKRMSVLSFSQTAFEKLSGPTQHFAQMEELYAHANSVRVRSTPGKGK